MNTITDITTYSGDTDLPQRARASGNMQPAFIRGVAREVYIRRYDRITPAPVMMFPELPSVKPAA
jgi:hypothetical protein